VSCGDGSFLTALQRVGVKLDDHVMASVALGEGRKKGRIWFAALMGSSLAVIVLVMALPFLAVMMVDFLPTSIDRELGEATGAQVQLGPEVTDAAVVEAVAAIRAHLETHANGEGHQFQVRVVENSLLNAFALPNGTILLTTGLLECAERPEQIAGVMAHEMAHVTLRHGLRSFMRGAGFIVMIRLLFGDEDSVANLMAQSAAVPVILGHSREHESAADMEALRTMHAAGLDPTALREMLVAMEAKSGVPEVDLPEWASTHPNVQSRAQAIDAAVAVMGPNERSTLQVNWLGAISVLKTRRFRQ
jgi:predicted Zn-dependent protease